MGAFDAARQADFAVGRAVHADGAVLIPVLALEAGLLAGGRRRCELAVGAAELELLGVWIGPELAYPRRDGPPDGPEPAYPRRDCAALPWLPARAEPPNGVSDWSSWLAARPELLARIGRALAAARPPDREDPG